MNLQSCDKRKTAAGIVLATATLIASGASAHDGKIALGDGNIATSPKRGNVMSCQQNFNPNAGGAHKSGPWIKGNYWYPSLKPSVDGSVTWTGNGLLVSVRGSSRVLTGKGLPSHSTGVYPIARTDDAYQYDRNPNRIRTSRVSLNLPANPVVAANASCVPMGMIGVALTGAAIFNALDGPGRDAVAHEIQDSCNGHPERSGQYHYHGPSGCMTETGRASNGHSGLVGYALDGFGIYGMNGAGGTHMTNAKLDACHGHTETVIWDGKPTKIYHYHLTDEYPYTLGCFKGTPVSTGNPQSGALDTGKPPSGKPDQHGREAVLIAAASELGITPDRLRRALGPPPPNFRLAAQRLGISENKLRRVFENARRIAGF